MATSDDGRQRRRLTEILKIISYVGGIIILLVQLSSWSWAIVVKLTQGISALDSVQVITKQNNRNIAELRVRMCRLERQAFGHCMPGGLDDDGGPEQRD